MNKRKPLIIILGIVGLLILTLGLYTITKKDIQQTPDVTSTSTQTSTDSSNQNSSNSPDQTTQKTFTKEEVATHSSETDCWTIINNKVYNITSYVSEHPGGTEILRACGIDGSSLFNNRTTASGEPVGSGTPHSSSAISQLEQLQIGTIQQ